MQRTRPSKMGNKGEYEVGKGKPPKEHQFQKGHRKSVGHGRPRTRMLTKELIAQLEEVDKKGKSQKEKFIKKLIDKAMGKGSGHASLMQEILNRIDGKTVQPIEIEGGAVQHHHIDLSKLTEEQLEFAESLGLAIIRNRVKETDEEEIE